jgi:two-component system sensor histidine kinase CpxA
MRSLYARILLICLATAFVSVVASLAVFLTVGRERYQKNFREIGRVEADLAAMTYRSGGPEALDRYAKRLDRDFGSVHYFVNEQGIDLITGEDRSAQMPASHPHSRPWTWRAMRSVQGYFRGSATVSVNRSNDGSVAMIAEASPWITARAQMPYYLAIMLGATLIQGLAAVRVVRSLRAIAGATERFGSGDLEARVAIAPRRDEIGKLAWAFNGMADHVRELVLAQRRLLQDVSHEFRSPLARLAFATELSRTAEDRNAAADEIRRQVDCLANLVGELVQLVRVEGDREFHRASEISIDTVVRQVVDACRLNAEEHRLRIVVLGVSHQLCLGDQTLVSRALDNLVRNALQYSPPERDVEVHLLDSERSVTVTIRDFGCGVPEAMKEQIFEPFFRVDESRHFSTGGAGLGLALVKRIVQAHHGTIHVENASPGLRVTLTLPAIDRRRLEARADASAA